VDLLLVALLVMAVAAVVAVALGAVRGGMSPVDEQGPPPLAEPLVRPSDLDRARFRLALRGYRMDQVDLVLDEARDLLAAKDEEIGRLRRLARPELLPGQPGDGVPAPVPAPVDHLGRHPEHVEPERVQQPERVERVERGEHPQQPGHPEHPEHREHPGQPERRTRARRRAGDAPGPDRP
jgi:DivIVA domain-containing protein